ncbi:MAG: FAD-dependent monooxygenase [Pyrinomonadaceae bacterium]|nr:FAD-dependent monooxygenase [Pyrinomonadaceae bacterium]
MSKIVIIGSGLAGSLLAIYLAKRGFNVEVYEARPDMRKVKISAGRSINLALSDRGILALNQVGLDNYILKEAIPMYGRMVHTLDGQNKFLPYSGRKGEYINSISRAGLNCALMDEAEKYGNVKIFFNSRCIGFDCNTGEAIIENLESAERKIVKGETLFAADGAGSVVRNAMLHGCVPRFNFSQSWLEHGYKELHIPPAEDGSFRMEKNALHIWARHSFMMIALPNPDGSFTCTLFLAHEGEKDSFESLKDESLLLSFFHKHFADAVPLMPTLVEDFFKNPTGNLGSIRCSPWHVDDKALLLGDAAHAIVPFYGQGMNCAFEDCRILNELIEEHGTDWKKIFKIFTEIRKPNTDAIADMAEENFYEMRDAVTDPVFQRKRELETKLEQTFPDYFSKYSMVTFREDLPYKVAKEKGNAQDKLLMEICSKIENTSEINLNEVMEKIRKLNLQSDNTYLENR